MPIINKFPFNVSLKAGTLFLGALSGILFLAEVFIYENSGFKPEGGFTTWLTSNVRVSIFGVVHIFILVAGVVMKWRFVLIAYLLANFILLSLEINCTAYYYSHNIRPEFALVAMVVHLFLEVFIWIGTISLIQQYYEEAKRAPTAAPATA